MKFSPSIFKDYDVRGHYPEEINPKTIKLIAKELVLFFKPRKVSIGRDNRKSSEALSLAAIEGLTSMGADVVDLGIITSDMIYFAAGMYNFDLNIIITGSHAEGENGFKICRKGAIAISGETGLYKVRDRLLKREKFESGKKVGKITNKNILQDWINHALGFINLSQVKPFKIVIDTGNGAAGPVIREVEKKLPGEFINLFLELDGTFPNHFPNPLIEENLKDIKRKIREEKADFGIAFDADGDRAFFLDENAKTISGTVLTAVTAKAILEKQKGETILYNAVCGRIVPETIKKYGGKPIRVRVGHSIIKNKMREHNAIFAGEHSGHFYFRDNFYADSGLIMTLITIEFISRQRGPLSKLVDEFDCYAQSGEINFKVKNREEIIDKIEAKYKKRTKTDRLDGLSVWFDDFWFNLRPSNTEPLVRLNLEADNEKILKEKLDKVIKEIEAEEAQRVK